MLSFVASYPKHKRPSLQARAGFLDLEHLESDAEFMGFFIFLTMADIITGNRNLSNLPLAGWQELIQIVVAAVELDKLHPVNRTIGSAELVYELLR